MKKLFLPLFLVFTMIISGCGDKEKTGANGSFKSIDELAEKADDVVKGIIVSKREESPDGGGSNSYTVFTFKVKEAYKGAHKETDTIEIKQLAGEESGLSASFEQSLKTQYVLFLESYDSIQANLLNPVQAAYFYRVNSELDSIESVNSNNDLALKHDDLQRIRDKYGLTD